MTYFDAPYRPADLTLNSDAINNSLVGFWPLTDGSGSSAVDVSTGGNSGTQSGGVSWASSEIGTVASFDGSNDQFDISHNSSYNAGTTGELTVTAWAKFDTFGTYRVIVSKDYGFNNGAREWVIYGELSGNRVSAQLFDSSGTAYSVGTAVNTINTGVWYFLSMVWDGTDLKLFVDGSVAHTVSAAITPRTSTEDVQIGYNGRFRHDGDVQNVRIFNAALTAAQVKQLYTRPWTGTNYDTEALWLSPPASPTLSTASEATSIMTDCVGWWPLVKGSGSTATDLVGSNDGTLSGGVSWENSELGTVASFDGVDDEINIGSITSGNSLMLNGTDATISVWFRSDRSGEIYPRLIDKANGGSGTGGWMFLLDSDTSNTTQRQYSFFVNGTKACAYGDYNPYPTDWTHLVVTMNSSTCAMYENGVPLSLTVNSPQTIPNTTAPCSIGSGGTLTTRHLAGDLSNVRVWERALTAEEALLLYARPWIGAEYNETAPLYPPVPSSMLPLDSSSINTDLQGWWPLTETDNFASGAADISGNSKTFTKVGTVTSAVSRLGGTADFDGNGDYLQNTTVTTSAFPWTLSAWGYYAGDGTNTDTLLSLGCSTSDTPYCFIFFNNTAGTAGGATRCSATGWPTQTITSSITAGNWYHLVWVQNSQTSSEFYVNGVSVGTDTTNLYSAPTPALDQVQAGILDRTTASNDMLGRVQNCRLWSRALSASEVADIYYSPWLGSAYTGTSSDPATNRFFSPAAFARLG